MTKLNDIPNLAPTLVYIMSPSYSGSTLITTKLAEVADISTIGELKLSSLGALDQYRCGCGSLIKACAFWRELTARLSDKGVDFSLDDPGTHFGRTSFENGKASVSYQDRVIQANVRNPLLEVVRNQLIRHVPGIQSSFRSLMLKNLMFMNTVCEMQGTDFFLDGSKDPLRLKYFLQQGWPVKVIYLTRDGRGTTNSIRKYERTSVAIAARHWQLKINEMLRVRSMIPKGQLYALKYEDYCTDPEGVTRDLAQFIGCDLTAASTRGEKTLHILGNDNMRKNRDRPVRLDEKWKTELSASEQSRFHQVAGSTNLLLGY